MQKIKDASITIVEIIWQSGKPSVVIVYVTIELFGLKWISTVEVRKSIWKGNVIYQLKIAVKVVAVMPRPIRTTYFTIPILFQMS